MKRIVVGLIIAAIAIAFVISKTSAQSQSDEQQKLTRGKALFESKCSLCHSIDKPLKKDFDRQKWIETVNNMSERMKKKGYGELTAEEKDLIVNYLVNSKPPKK